MAQSQENAASVRISQPRVHSDSEHEIRSIGVVSSGRAPLSLPDNDEYSYSQGFVRLVAHTWLGGLVGPPSLLSRTLA